MTKFYERKTDLFPGLFLAMVFCVNLSFLSQKYWRDHASIGINPYFIPIVYFLSLASFYVVCDHGPGQLNSSNISKYIEIFGGFPKVKICNECKVLFIQRSRHCDVCEICVPKQDHHCIWLNQCIGYRNYKYFFIALIIQTFCCLYAAYAGYKILLFVGQNDSIFFRDLVNSTGNPSLDYFLSFIVYSYWKAPGFTFSVFLAFVLSFCLLYMCVNHVLLIKNDTTLAEVRNFIRAGKNESRGFIKNFVEILKVPSIE